MDWVLKTIDEALERKHLSDAAASKLAVGHPSLIKNLRAPRAGEKRYNLPALEKLANVLDLELYFGPPREAAEPPKALPAPNWSRFSSDKTLPQRGIAKCSVKGWGKSQPLNDPLTAPDAIGANQAFYVTASGQSMIPEGIQSGDTVLITNARAPEVGERAWIIGQNGEASIKRLIGRNDRTVRLRGWMPVHDGQQQSFEEELVIEHLKALAPVIAVYEGRPGSQKVSVRVDPKVAPPTDVDSDDLVTIHMHPLQRTMKDGAGMADKNVPRGLAFPRDWLKRQGILASHASLLAVDGTDMEPTFGCTSIALINHRRTRVQHRRCYAFMQGGDMHIKRLEKLSETHLLVVSDNPSFRSILLHGDQLDKIEIVGEVVWAGQSF